MSFPHLSVSTRPLLILLALLLFAPAFAQKKDEGKKKKIEWSADNMEGDKKKGKDVKKLVGHVHFRHENVDMYCDSAYLFPNNSLEAYRNVRILQGDTIQVYGDMLKYDGNTKIAELQKNVSMSDREMNLKTEYLTYDLNSSVGSYHNGGTIISKDNTLKSEHGYYNSKAKEFSFKKNVVLVNPQYTMKCDTLLYNTYSKVAYFLGPTTIVSNENTIYCENGWYDTDRDVSQFNKNAVINTREQKLKGDSIYYNRKAGFGKAIKNVSVIDSAQNVTITGNYAEYYEKTENSLITGRALLTQVYDKDSLFLHADTLRATYETKDSAGKKLIDYDKRILYAYHHVKFFKSDIQGKCDSLVYTYGDSTMRLYRQPVLWSEKNQLTAEKVEIRTGSGEIRSLVLSNTAFIVSREDSVKFNQVKGKNMTAYFMKNKLYKIKVEGNGQAVYYPRDQGEIFSVNKTDCTDMLIFFEENEVNRITFITKPEGSIFPISEINPKEFLLKDMKDRFGERPMAKNDVFSR